ncbi:hypothetical protein V5O48_004661 [Marasmius crinis-equi]|uniref:F-box domain-containing protein n=1 Tax=Marasmius crinis-equi TaxID=585013 RepID=A0ABR3FPK0_9AGAR
MKLDRLPDDVLFNIFLFLDPDNIIRLRKTNRRLHDFTWESTVWRNVHRNSTSFLPPFQSTNSFQRLIVQASPLEKTWRRMTRSGRFVHGITYEPDLGGSAYIHLLDHGRFLLFGLEKSMALYDLERANDDRLIFNFADPTAKFLYAQDQSSTTLGTGDIYVAALVREEFATKLVIWQLSGAESDVRRVADLPLPPLRDQTSPNILLSNGVVVFDTETQKSIVYHIKTQRFYQFPAGETKKNPWNTYQNHTVVHISALRAILIIHTDIQPESPMKPPFFEFFTFPEGSSQDVLIKTHSGECPRYFAEPRFIAFSFSHNPEPLFAEPDAMLRVSLAAIFHGMDGDHAVPVKPTAVRPFHLLLHADGTMSSHFLRFSTPPAGTSSPLSGLILTSDGVSRARAVVTLPAASSEPASQGRAVLYDIDLETEEAIAIVGLIPTGRGTLTSFDGFRGRFCEESCGSIMVMDAL